MNRVVVAALLVLWATAIFAGSVAGQSIALRDLAGNRVYLDSLLAKGPVVLNFWATWCKPCRIEIPHLERIYREFSPKGVQFGAVSIDTRRDKKRVEQFIEDAKLSLPVYRDTQAIVAKKFKVAAIPTTVILDRSGAVHYSARWYRRGDEIILRKQIEAVLRSKGEGEGDTQGTQ